MWINQRVQWHHKGPYKREGGVCVVGGGQSEDNVGGETLNPHDWLSKDG